MIRKAIVATALMLALVAGQAKSEVIILPNGGTVVKSGSVTITPGGTYMQGDGYTVSPKGTYVHPGSESTVTIGPGGQAFVTFEKPEVHMPMVYWPLLLMFGMVAFAIVLQGKGGDDDDV